MREFVHDPMKIVSGRISRNGCAGGERHVGEGADRRLALARVVHGLGVGHHAVDRDALARVRSPGDVRTKLGSVDRDLPVERRAVVRRQRSPVLQRAVPVPTLRRVRAPLDVGERRVVGRDHARARAGLDRHVADGHAALHRERPDRRTPVLHDVTDAAARPDAGDDPQDHVLRRDAGRQLALDRHGHGAGFGLRQGLRGQDVLDLRRPDAERERAERAVRGGVRVAAHDHQTRLRVALLGTDHVHDALARRAHREERDAELRGVRGQRVHLALRDRVGDGTDRRRNVVIHGRDGEVRAADGAAVQTQSVERLRAGDLVHQVQVHIEEVGLAVGSMDDVAFPDLLRERL